ncbi:hypothetical protein MB27_10990 [Actinoplanes utahensis]|uniref:Uncharacterized protein n=1 Tax=Actinoplanes utahensis TaxID=1869 RepID=A0A0A6URE1_ACTUT|nr:hypothetical protein MB27_10990 [Actinoplanes utahensis]
MWLNIVFTVALTIVSGVIVNKITTKFTWALLGGLVVIGVGLAVVTWFDKRSPAPAGPPPSAPPAGRFENVTITDSPLSAVGERNVVQIGSGNAASPGEGGTAVAGRRNGLLAAVVSLIVAVAVVGGTWLWDRAASAPAKAGSAGQTTVQR